MVNARGTDSALQWHMKLRNVIAGIALMSLASSVIAGLDKGYAAYEKGDYKTALQEFKLSAERGNSEAQFATGVMFANARGVPQDYKEAVKWFRLGADQGNASAQLWLGAMYDSGEGVAENDKEAFKWYKLAAEQSESTAQYNLAVMYQGGEGVAKNFIQSYAWFSIAAANGDKDALAGRDEVIGALTKAQLSKAKELAAEYLDKYLHKKAGSVIYLTNQNIIAPYRPESPRIY